MKFLKKFLWVILFSADALALLLLLIASFSDQISPFRSVLASYTGLFFPFIVIANLLFFILFLLFQKWKIVGINLVVLLICSGAIRSYFPINPKEKEIPEDAISILTYNTMMFARKKHTAKNPNPILEYILKSDADIVCMQEFGATRKENGQTLSMRELLGALKKYPYHFVQELSYIYKSEKYGVAIFSRFPITSVKKIDYESRYNGSVWAELDINGKRVTLINNHLESNKLSEEERNEYYQLTKEVGSQALNSFTKMMHKRLTPAFKARALQAQIISKVIEEDKNNYMIVCGDFNDTPISYARRKIKGNLKDAFVESGAGLGVTYNKYRFLFRIDYILHSQNIRSYNCTVGKLKDSDHYPVSCFLKLED